MATAGLHDSELGELQRRLIILRVGLLLVVALLGLQLWNLQIREGPYYRDLSENNRTRSVIMEPARGLIYDRNGVLLANNVPSFTLYVSLEDVKDREGLIRQLTNLLGLDEALIRKKLAARGSRQLPRKVKDRLTLREATLIESHRLDLPGVMVQRRRHISWAMSGKYRLSNWRNRNFPSCTKGASLDNMVWRSFSIGLCAVKPGKKA